MTDYNERLDEIVDTLNQFAPDQLVEEMRAQAKQAITTLIKELVAEAKPTRSETQIGNFIIYGDLSKRELNIIDQFERNLLNALEEK